MDNETPEEVDEAEVEEALAVELPKTVTLGGIDIEIGPPASYTVRAEIWKAATKNMDRAFAAALGACWRSKGRPKAKYDAHGYNPLAYGGAVLDELVGRGLDPAEVFAAGGVAYLHCARGFIREKEVKDRVGFSKAPEPASTE